LKIGVFTVALADRDLEQTLDAARAAGCEAVELGTGAYIGDAHCNPRRLLNDRAARERFQQALAERGLEISAFSCHGNPLHPDATLARAHDDDFRATVELAGELGVDTVITLSGCPGDGTHARRPSWIVCSWPDENLDTLEWQWEACALPYWRETAEFCRARGVRAAIEPHPGFLVYNVDSWRRLAAQVGDGVAVNFDPSHFFWQGMDPLACVRELGDAIVHVHAKDTAIDHANVRRNGVLDPGRFSEPAKRSWRFCTVGHAHDASFWRALATELRLVGYDGVLSIEHEDALLTPIEGITKAAALLRDAVPVEPVERAWWVE
jgi:sugar phosphate isomerase/epimerase